MASRRQKRVADLIHEQISKLLQFDVRDPRIGFITVTDAEVTPDLKVATIYISLLSGDELAEREALTGLESAKSYLRHELGQRVKLRYIPELRFELDRSQAYAQHINTLLSQLEIPPEAEDEPEADDEPAN